MSLYERRKSKHNNRQDINIDTFNFIEAHHVICDRTVVFSANITFIINHRVH